MSDRQLALFSITLKLEIGSMPGETASIEVRSAQSDEDWAWLGVLWREEWAGETMVSRGRVHHLTGQSAVIAWEGETRIGAASYTAGEFDWELTSINSLVPGKGIGPTLLKTVEAAAMRGGAERLWLITTNDNLHALRFYQRRGYRLVAVYAGSVDEARKLKPTIPELGNDGIPLHDEIELEKRFV